MWVNVPMELIEHKGLAEFSTWHVVCKAKLITNS
jgi:hypothetical protein